MHLQQVEDDSYLYDYDQYDSQKPTKGRENYGIYTHSQPRIGIFQNVFDSVWSVYHNQIKPQTDFFKNQDIKNESPDKLQPQDQIEIVQKQQEDVQVAQDLKNIVIEEEKNVKDIEVKIEDMAPQELENLTNKMFKKIYGEDYQVDRQLPKQENLINSQCYEEILDYYNKIQDCDQKQEDLLEDKNFKKPFHYGSGKYVRKLHKRYDKQYLSDSSNSTENEESISNQFHKLQQQYKQKRLEHPPEYILKTMLSKQLQRSRILQDQETNQYVNHLVKNLLQMNFLQTVLSKKPYRFINTSTIQSQLNLQQMKFVNEFMFLDNQKSMPILKKIVGKLRGIDSYLDKRKDLKITCPILEKIIKVERIKCAYNKTLNYKDVYQSQFDFSKQNQEKQKVQLRMNQMPIEQQPQELMQILLQAMFQMDPKTHNTQPVHQEIKDYLLKMVDIEKFLKFENADERTKIEMQKRDVDNKFENIKLQLQSS